MGSNRDAFFPERFTNAMNFQEGIQLLHIGVFRDERVQQLLLVMTRLSDQLLDELQTETKKIMSDRSGLDPKNLYRKGLDSIPGWDRTVQDSETAKACAKFPMLASLYKYSVVKYVQEVYKCESHVTIDLSIPPLREFIMRYFMNLVMSKPVRSQEWYTLWGIQKSLLMVETLRATLFDCVKSRVSFRKNTAKRESIDHDIKAREMQLLAELNSARAKCSEAKPPVGDQPTNEKPTVESVVPDAPTPVPTVEPKPVQSRPKSEMPRPRSEKKPENVPKSLDIVMDDKPTEKKSEHRKTEGPRDDGRPKKEPSKVIYTESK